MVLPDTVRPILIREVLGEVLRSVRLERGLTLREVSGAARVSLGYLSEIERGQKEASSELLNAICGALDITVAAVLRRVSDQMEPLSVVATLPVRSHRAAA